MAGDSSFCRGQSTRFSAAVFLPGLIVGAWRCLSCAEIASSLKRFSRCFYLQRKAHEESPETSPSDFLLASSAMLSTRFRGLRGRFLLLVIAIYAAVGLLSLIGFYRVADSIIHRLGAGYATQYAGQQRSRILAKIERELVLAQKLVDSPLLRSWCLDEANPQLKRAALAELDSYRKLFADHSYFFIVDKSRNYYFNDAINEFSGKELRYTMNPDDPTMAWYFSTLQTGDDFDLHVDNNPHLGVTKVWINAVVKDGARKIGLGGSGIDLSEFLKEIVRSRDAGIENVLVDDNGYVQGHSDQSLMDDNARIRDESQRLTIFKLLDNTAERETLKQILQSMKSGGAQEQQSELTINGRQRLAAISYLPEIHWAAIVLVDPGEVIRLETFRPIIFLMGAALLVTILLVSWLLDRLVLTRLLRLIGLTRDIAAGQYDRKLRVDHDDEIGQLMHSVNTMSTTIADYTQNLEQKVSDRTDALEQSNALLETSNRKVMDSIEYARLIQSSILAKREDLSVLLSDYAVLWQPRDIVGGDFYSLYRDVHGGFLIAVADCTGHGVSGAFMTMASKALLDRAVATGRLDNPAALIAELHRGLRSLLQSRYASDADNGLDLALLYVSPQREMLTFSAAKLPLWVIGADGNIRVCKGDRHSVGYRKRADEIGYTNHQIAGARGQRYVLFSDGILDQHGGAKGFAFGQAKLKETLSMCREQPLAQLADTLAAVLANYLGG
jgi:sigma-B regulation protein RsbU (phosphoserine phosphatase)